MACMGGAGNAYLVYTGCVKVPNATMQCASYNSFQALSTRLERPEADCRQLYLVIELYRRRNARRLAHQVQSCSSRAAALCLDDHTSMSLPLTKPSIVVLRNSKQYNRVCAAVNAACRYEGVQSASLRTTPINAAESPQS